MSEDQDSKIVKFSEGIDFNQNLFGLNGETTIKGDSEGGRTEVTLGGVCQAALLSSVGDKPDQTTILKQFNLAQKVGKPGKEGECGGVTVSSKDKTMILKQGEALVQAGAWSILLFARVYEALEGSTEE